MEEGEKIEPTLTGEDIRLIHSMSDFQQALSAITFIDELEPDQKMTRIELRRYRCIEDAAVVAYWRPFSECNGLPKLSLRKLGLKPSPAEARLHEELRVHRNKVVAHTDIERMTFSFAAFRAFEDGDIFMPHLVRDDSLALFDRRHEWMAWVRKVHLTVARLVFERAQVLGEAAFLFVPDS